jgi:hypothetical protein
MDGHAFDLNTNFISFVPNLVNCGESDLMAALSAWFSQVCGSCLLCSILQAWISYHLALMSNYIK